ncbi:MAG: hypothetical protein LBI34_00430 [Puniceicoccales bacterium]|jgi:hypothetical protein|nr:hypothetical protein [Puniceicoccales bacterium]
MFDGFGNESSAVRKIFSQNQISPLVGKETVSIAFDEGNSVPSEADYSDSMQTTERMAQIYARQSNFPLGMHSSMPAIEHIGIRQAREIFPQNILDADAHISGCIARIDGEIETARLALPYYDCDSSDVDKCIKKYNDMRKGFYGNFIHKKFFKGLKRLAEGQIRGINAATYAPRKYKLNQVSMLVDYKSIMSRGDNFHKFVADKLLQLYQMSNGDGEDIYSDLLRDGFAEEYTKNYILMRREIFADLNCRMELENICWRSYDSFPASTAQLMDAFYRLCERLFGDETYDYRLLFSGYFRNYCNHAPNGGSCKYALFQNLACRARVADEDTYYWGRLYNFSDCADTASEMYGDDNDRLFKIFAAMHALATIILSLCDAPGKSADGKKITICRMEGSDLIGKRGAAMDVPKNKPGERQYVKHLPLICASLGGSSQLVGRKITIYKDIPLHRIYSGYFLEDDLLGRVREFGISFFGEGLGFFHIGNLRGKKRYQGPIVRYDESYDELFHFPKATHRLDANGNKVFTPFGALEFLKNNFSKNNFPGREFLNINVEETSDDKWRKAAKFLCIVHKHLPSEDSCSVQLREACDVVLNFACEKIMEKPTIEQAFVHASQHYNKKFPDYEKIQVVWDGNVEYFSQLGPKIQLQLLKNSIRGNGGRRTLNEIEKLLSRPETEWDQSKITNLMKSALRVSSGRASQVHSALHSARAAIFVEIFANIYRRLFKEFENLSSEDVYRATIAALFHDSGREAEGIDVFEELSAQNAKNYLLSKWFPDESIEKVEQIILHKDAPVSGKDLAAILLHEADCIEYLRLSNFSPRYLDAYGGTGQSTRLTFTPLDNIGEQEVRDVLTRLVKTAREIIHGPAPALETFIDEQHYAALRAEMIERTRSIWDGIA